MENKRSTSIQYQYTNVKLFNEIFYNWKEFNSYLSKGPDVMKNHFLSGWNETKEMLKKNKELIVKDLEKEVSKENFDVTFNKTSKGTAIFFLTFPNYEYRDAASKYIALALTPECPRFITLECSEHFLTKEACWVIGEFFVDKNTNLKKHKNYGTVDNDRLTFFAGYVIGMLEDEGI